MSTKSKNDIRPFTEAEYAIIVIKCLINYLKRPGNFMTEIILGREIDGDAATSAEIVEALRYAIEAVKAQRERDSEEKGEK